MSGKEARELDVRRPVRRCVHDMRRRTDEIRITRFDRKKEGVASARKPDGDACCIHGRVKRSPNVPTRSPPSATTHRSAHRTAWKPHAGWARQRPFARDQAGKTLKVAHRVSVSSAAIGLASTVGCERANPRLRAGHGDPRPTKSDSERRPCGRGAESRRSLPAVHRGSPDQRQIPRARIVARLARTADPRPRPETHTREWSPSALRVHERPWPWRALSSGTGHPSCPSSRTRPDPPNNCTTNTSRTRPARALSAGATSRHAPDRHGIYESRRYPAAT